MTNTTNISEIKNSTAYDVATLIAKSEEVALRVSGESKTEDLCDKHFDLVEDFVCNSVVELISEPEKFNQSVDLLNANGLSNVSQILKSLAEGIIALEWYKEHF